ncbi:hypothetical protein ACWET9_34205 [Streptomyces sp. NPDC004059]
MSTTRPAELPGPAREALFASVKRWGPGGLEVIVVPEPGSKKYDTRRARLRKDAEDSGVSDQDANTAANESLQEEPQWRSRGPKTERGRDPKGERRGNA